MQTVQLTKPEWDQLMNILATTKEHPWMVTNPLLMKIGQQLQALTPGPAPSGVRLDANGKEIHHE